jgi:hypothetical protein
VNRPVLVIAGCAALTIIGLVLATVGSPPGTVLTIAGIALWLLYLIGVFRLAWSGDQKRAWGPGSLRREYRDEQVAKRE